MTTLAYPLPVAGTDLNSIADPELVTALQSILTWANGNIDLANLSAALAQSAGLGPSARGAVNIATAQATSSSTYTTLATPDRVTSLALPTNGLIAIWYQANWLEGVAAAGRAAIFLNANQVKVAAPAGAGTLQAVTQAAATSGATINVNVPLFTTAGGLSSANVTSAYSGDAATGQIVGGAGFTGAMELGGTVSTEFPVGAGPCYVFAPAGTYTISVQFKATSGSVTVAARKLWVQAQAFS